MFYRWLAIALLLVSFASCDASVGESWCDVWTSDAPITPTSRIVGHWQVDAYRLPFDDGRIHEPSLAPDGAVWFADQTHGCLGRLDPGTGDLGLISPIATNADLHSLAVDSGGTVWYATGNAARLGRLNLITDQHDDFALPSEVRDVHTVLVTAGQVWFTSPGSDRFGVFDINEGVRELFKGTMPYGLTSSSDGLVWAALAGTDSVASVAADGTRRDWALAHPTSRPRRLVADSAGRLWYNDRDRSVVGRVDPSTGFVDEFPTLSPDAFPTSIASGSAGRVWYYEVRTGLLVEFDAERNTHETIAFDLSDGGVNHMVIGGREPALWLALGSALVRIMPV